MIKKIVIEATKRFPGEKPVSLGAFTGAAAVNIGGSTLHSLFHLPTRDSFSSLTGKRLTELQNEFKETRFIIIDEMSMMSARMLAMIDERCRQAKSINNIPFGGMMVYLFGDFRQLPPVGVPALFSGNKLSNLDIAGKLLLIILTSTLN